VKLNGRQQEFAAVTENIVWLMIISQKEGA